MKLKYFFVLFLFPLFIIQGELIAQTPTNYNYTTPANSNTVPVFSDQELQTRIVNLSDQAVSPELNSVVKSYINTYTVLKRERTEKMLGRIVMYFPLFEKYLLENNMPIDVKYLSVVESGLDPNAVSRAGAVGLWQFMPGTGQEYGLQINSHLDERQDPIKSTKAAINYLKRLYNKYKDWELALAAYNSGPGRVNRAIKRGRSKNFWTIRKYLPRETRNYVPAFVAANYIVNYYPYHKLNPHYPELELQMTEATKVYQSISFREISVITGTPIHFIKKLNPSYKRGIIPSSREGHNLILPKKNMPSFNKAFSRPDSPQNVNLNENRRQAFFKSVYIVQPGDTIDHLANIFNCHRRHIMAWNNLAQPFIRLGQELTIYQLSNLVSTSMVKILPPRPIKLEKPKLNEETILSLSKPPISRMNTSSRQPSSKEKKGYLYHIIQRNESLIDIADKYQGVSVQDILKLNKIKGNDFLSIGVRIKIKKI